MEFEGYLKLIAVILIGACALSGLCSGEADDWLRRHGLGKS